MKLKLKTALSFLLNAKKNLGESLSLITNNEHKSDVPTQFNGSA